MWSRISHRNHVLDGVSDTPQKHCIIWGLEYTHEKGHCCGTHRSMPAIDILTAICKAQRVAMRPLAIINVEIF